MTKKFQEELEKISSDKQKEIIQNIQNQFDEMNANFVKRNHCQDTDDFLKSL